MFEDTKEEVRGEEETGGEEEAKMGQCNDAHEKCVPACNGNRDKTRDIKDNSKKVSHGPNDKNLLPTTSPTTQATKATHL